MNAVTHFHFSLWGDYSVVPVEDRQRSDSIFAAARELRGGHRQSRLPAH
jgi:hypothetical protein